MTANPYQAPTVAGPTLSDVDCALCHRVVARNKSRELYRHPVCKKCLYRFVNRRQIAAILDAIIWRIEQLMLITALAFTMDAVISPESEAVALQLGVAAIYWFAVIGVFITKDGFSGHSLGKFVLGLRVVDKETGEPIGFLTSAKRNWPLVIPIVPLVLAFLINKGPRWGDGWANSKVIWKKFADTPVFRSQGEKPY